MGLRAFYGDLSSPRVFAIDVDSMTRIVDSDITINAPAYPVDKVTSKLLYCVTRGEKSVTPIDLSTFKSGKPIKLQHKPRSTTVQGSAGKELCLIAGADQPVTSVVDVAKSKVIQLVGQPTSETDTDFGGGLASGHPIWVGKNHFLQLDRIRRTISLFQLGNNLPLETFRTPTSCHHIEEYGKGYVALCEGNTESKIPPALVFFNVNTGRKIEMEVCNVLFMPSADGGAHHISMIEKTIYVPTSNGVVYVVEPTKSGFKFRKPIMAGKGAGHVFFNRKSTTGAIVNHTDEFVTLFNQTSHTRIANVKVTNLPTAGKKSQAHTAKVSSNGKYFYGAASQEGEFFRIDLAKKKKDKVLDLNTFGSDAQPLQGVIF
jgi:hypothetical protein